ncbi:MAG: hypothetical protein ABL878_03770 [Burkholderiales bacterium]
MKIQNRNISFRAMPHAQRGVVLMIALIVLVSMTLAAIGMSRSVDTASVVAGNMSFKQSTLQGGDVGVQAATTWLTANSGGTTLQNTSAGNGYFSAAPAAEPDWTDMASWGNARLLNGGVPDNSGNVVRYVIHRMCRLGDSAYNGVVAGQPNQCAMYYPTSAGASGGSMAVGSTVFEGIPQLYYRVTTRIDGPRNTLSIIQVSVLIQV